MGSNRLRRDAFFREHQWCCFCGGKTPANEIDHVPGRHLFRSRGWPEGYEFPACATCNRASAIDELAMGWLVRITISDIDSADERELEQATEKLKDRRPDWIQNLREMSRLETRRHLRDRGLSLETFRGVELSVVIPPTELLDVPQRYGAKIAKALYYMHSGRVVPANGVIKVRALTNSEFMSTKFPLEGFSFLTAQPLLTRAGKRLDDQFAYRYAVATDGPAAGFLIQFRESMAIIALVYEEAAAYEDRMAARRRSGAARPA